MTDLKQRLQDEMSYAAYEDHWDELLRKQHCVGQHQTEEPTWTDCYKKSLENHTKAMGRFTWRNKRIASQMQQIVNRERELAEEERKERRRAKVEQKKKMLKEFEEQQSIGHTKSGEKTYEAYPSN
jgi:hypothetical protein